jgi:S-(hydroxymethyl)glutathione dehydrogenase/alcohol dehydrogenase
MKTRAAILVEQRQPLVIDEVEVPVLSYGQVLVEIRVSRICGSQIGEIDGVKGPDRFLPHLLGHEAGAVVREIGPEVRRVKSGDRVVCHWRPGNGIESRPPIYGWTSGRKVNAGFVTTFGQFAVVSENRLTVVPPGTDFTVCALLADTLTTGFGIVNRDANLMVGQSLVVIGAGGIGLGVVWGAKLAGAYPLIAVDLHDHKLQVAARYGATHVINAQREDFAEAALRILNQVPPDVVVDGTGNPAVLEKALALTSNQGRCIEFGVMPQDRRISFNPLPLHFGKVLTGSHGGGSKPAEDIPRILRLIRGGGGDPAGFVSHRTTLDRVNETIEQMRGGQVIHAMIDF